MMAMEKPILASLEGEAAEILKDSGAAMVVPPEDKEGAVRLSGEPAGATMGHVAATRGHLVLLPAGAAYQLRAGGPGVALYQSVLGEESIEKWAEICLR